MKKKGWGGMIYKKKVLHKTDYYNPDILILNFTIRQNEFHFR